MEGGFILNSSNTTIYNTRQPVKIQIRRWMLAAR
jgi:hypothetical protein